jgi:hypothetical protein
MGMPVNLYPRRRGRDEQLPTPIMEMVRLIAAPVADAGDYVNVGCSQG